MYIINFAVVMCGTYLIFLLVPLQIFRSSTSQWISCCYQLGATIDDKNLLSLILVNPREASAIFFTNSMSVLLLWNPPILLWLWTTAQNTTSFGMKVCKGCKRLFLKVRCCRRVSSETSLGKYSTSGYVSQIYLYFQHLALISSTFVNLPLTLKTAFGILLSMSTCLYKYQCSLKIPSPLSISLSESVIRNIVLSWQ